MRTLYYPAQQGKQAELCRTLASAILTIIRDPETEKPVEQYKQGFTELDLKNEGIPVPRGGMRVLSERGWIVRSPAARRRTTPGGVWVLTREAIRFIEGIQSKNSEAGGI